MSSIILEEINQVFLKLTSTPDTEVSTLCERVVELLPGLIKEDQQEFCSRFYKWAGKYKTKIPVIFCYAQHLQLATNFFSEQHETVLKEAPGLQKALLENNEPAAVAAIEVLVGSIHRTLGNVDLSLRSLWDAYRQLNKLNRFRHYKTASSFHIGSIYVELNNNEEALPILNNTLSLAKDAGDDIMTVYTLHSLGKMYLKEKNYENARLMFREAMDAAGKAATPALVSSAETEMGNYFFETGNYDESEMLHTKAVETRIANKFIGGAITNYIRLGEINIRQSQPDEAIRVLNQGLALAEQIKVKPKMYQIHFLLSEIYHSKNDLNSSLFHYKQYHTLQEQAGQEDNIKRIKNVKLVFEAEQTKKENAIIRKQKNEIQKKNIELQETIDELTITKAGKKAKAFTLLIAILFFVFEDSILHFVFHLVSTDNFWLFLGIKMVIVFSLKPINGAIEHYLVRKVIKRKKRELEEDEYMDNECSTELDITGKHTQSLLI